jgi:hypothetical protein
MFFGISCSTIPGITESRSWSFPEGQEMVGTVWISPVSADKAGGWLSVESEMMDLLPLLFMKKNYLVVSRPEDAMYTVEAKAREREYLSGWRTRSSVSVEIYIRPGERSPDTSAGALPLAAGRVTVQGSRSLSSSKTLSGMLEKAITKAVKALERS